MSRATWAPAAAAFLAVALGTLSAALLWEWMAERRRKRELGKQLRALGTEGLGEGRMAAQPLFRGTLGPRAAWLGRLFALLPRLKDLELLLLQAGLSWRLETLFVLSVGLGVASGVGVLVSTGLAVAAGAAAALGAGIPYLYVRRRRTKRLRAFEEMLPESIDLISRAIRAGHPLSSGFKMVGDEGPEPVAGEFRRVFEEQRYGLPLLESLLGMTDRVSLIDVRILITAILIQREVGGNLAEVLDNLASVIRARFTIRRQLRVFTAQGRLTGYLLAVLPFILAGILFLINRQYMLVLFTDPIGKALIAGGVMLQFAGYLWIRKIVNIEI
jgi:tight adherence protein B